MQHHTGQENRPEAAVAPVLPAHHQPPAVEYRDGVPYHYTVGQPPAPAHITVQMPETSGMSPAMREFAQFTVVWLVVAVVLSGCVIGVTVIAGGTLMGIIGAVGANAVPIAVAAVVTLAAAGWAASRIRGLVDATGRTRKTGVRR